MHEIKPDPNNLATLGQNVIDVPEDKAVYAELKAGQVVFHHESVVHSSGPNEAIKISRATSRSGGSVWAIAAAI